MIEIEEFSAAVRYCCPGQSFLCDPETYEGLVMLDGDPKPSLEAIEQAWVANRDAYYRGLIPPITDIQLRAWLFAAGKLEAIQTAINTIPDAQQRFIAQTRFQREKTIRRMDPLTVWCGEQLGMTAAELDAAFLAAAQI